MTMRKFLLFAATAMFVASANAQVLGSRAQHHALPQATKAKYEMVPAKNVGIGELTNREAGKKMTVEQKSLKAASKATNFRSSAMVPFLASEVQPVYEAYAVQRSDGESVTWEMKSGKAQYEDGTEATVMVNVVPNIFEFENGVMVEYEMNGDTIVIQPQLVASYQTQDGQDVYLFLESGTTNDGSIKLALDENGRIKGTYSILYGAYGTETYNSDDYLGYYEWYQTVQYNLPGEYSAPVVSFEPSSLMLYAGMGISGYHYNANLAMTAAFAPLHLKNLTTTPATAWDWQAVEEETDSIVLTGNTKDFEFKTKGEAVYSQLQLVGYNKDKASEPFTHGVKKTVGDDGYEFEDFYLYGSGSESTFTFSDGSTATLTRQDPDGDLKFYTNWGTPDLYETTSIHKIYIYHDKPAAPLYITGVTLPIVGGNFQKNFELKMLIYKCTRNAAGTSLVLGDLIAQADAVGTHSVNTDYQGQSGLSAINFTELYTEDELGMSEEIDHLFLDSEFVIVIDGWDNGTFSGVLGSQDAPLDNAGISTWFERTGYEGEMRAYTSWKTSLFVGLLGANFGYLHTEDPTDIHIDAEGGEATLNVTPQYYSISDEDGSAKTRLFLESVKVDDEELDELPEWLTLEYSDPVQVGVNDNGDPVYDTNFTLNAKVEALPEGVETRHIDIVLWQEGAQLKLNITQGKDENEFTPVPFDGADGKYYLINIASNKCWGAGNSWGTQASLVEHLEYVTLLKQPDGTYYLESQVSNGGDNYYFGGEYMDGQPVPLTITAVNIIGYSDDAETVPVYAYTIANGDNYYGWDGNSTVLGRELAADSENAQWVIATEEQAIAALAEATAEDPVDATFLLLDPNFGRNNRNQAAWTGDAFSVGGDNTNFNAEKWGGNSQTFDISQTVNVPNGLYKISWNGFYRYNNTPDNTNDIAIAAHADGTEVINSFIYINGNNYPLTSIADEAASAALEGKLPFSQGEASAAFGQGLYAQSATVIVNDGKLTVGIKKTNHPGCDWTVWDNFTLQYFGATDNNPDDPELVAPEGWTSVISNGNLAGNSAVNFIAKEYPSTEPAPANIVDGAGKNNSRGVVVKSQNKVKEAWDSQFWIKVNEKLPEGTKLHVEFDYKADNAGKVSTQAHGAPGNYQHWAAIGDVTFATEWNHFSTDIEVSGDMATGNGGDGLLSIAFNLNDIADANTFYFDNFGVWAQKPAPVDEWVDILVNGDMESTTVQNFLSKEYPSTQILPARIVDGAGKDGSRGIEIDAPAKVKDEWDSQFWIYLPTTLPEGTKYKVEFDYRADRNATADTQAHGEPGNYIFYSMIGSPNFTTEWQHYEKSGSISADQAVSKDESGNPTDNKFRSIAFNLSKDSENAVKYFFDNVKFFVEKSFYETGIVTIDNSQKNEGTIYNLRGQKVQNAQKGLYIINGKKVVLK